MKRRIVYLLICLSLLFVFSINAYASPDLGKCPSCGSKDVWITYGACAGGVDDPHGGDTGQTCDWGHTHEHDHFRMYIGRWMYCPHCGHGDKKATVIMMGPSFCIIEQPEYYHPHLGPDVGIGTKYPIDYFVH